MFNPIKGWFYRQRASIRLALILQIVVRILFSVLSLIWTPLLLRNMGDALNGVYLNFQRITSLGGLGDLGMGGAVNIRTSRLLGQRKEGELRDFLAAARGIFLLMAVVAGIVFLVVSPHVFRGLEFGDNSRTGSWPMLSLVGAIAISFVVLNSYVSNLNYGCANIVLPIVPAFLVTQAAILCHWLLARQHAPLWAQYVPYVFGAALTHIFGWLYVKNSFASLAVLWPLRFNRKQFIDLFGSSFWVYLSAVGAGIWVTTDMLLITARFGPEIIPAYQYNYKLCELAAFVINSANVAGMSKIAQWIASPEAPVRERGIQEIMRLGKFQTVLGCAAALIYLNVNDWFMRLWLGPEYQVPFLWQIAFAASVAVAGSGQMVCALAQRCSDKGLRIVGTTALFTALLNFGLSFTAMKLSPVLGINLSIFGIGMATVIAQSSRDIFIGRYAAGHLNISLWKLNIKNWVLAVSTIACGYILRLNSERSGPDIFMMIMIQTAWLLIVVRLAGVTLKDLQREKAILKSMLKI